MPFRHSFVAWTLQYRSGRISMSSTPRQSPRPIGELAEDAVMRGLAGAVIVSGAGTGHPTNLADLRAVRAALPGTPIYVGSGATETTLLSLLEIANGAIVGTAAKVDSIFASPVDPHRVRALVAAARSISDR